MLLARTHLDVECERVQVVDPSRKLAWHFGQAVQPFQAVVVSPHDEFLTGQVVLKILHPLINCE